MSNVKWWRVIDPLNPLCGCDVTLAPTEHGIVKFEDPDNDNTLYGAVTGLRRMDILMGDRPFQLIRKDGQDIGVLVRLGHLEVSPIQDDVVEIAYDLPNGKCLDEDVLSDGGDAELRIAKYENATQVAFGQPEGELYATCTLRGPDQNIRLDALIRAYRDKTVDFEDMIALMQRENH